VGEAHHDREPGARLTLRQLALAGVGWAAVGVEALDELADELARKVGVDSSEMRAAVRDTAVAWRRDAERLGARGDDAVDHVLERLGLARQDEVDELTLRVAQLEHRLRLLEAERAHPGG